jgi:hypothetical protein
VPCPGTFYRFACAGRYVGNGYAFHVSRRALWKRKFKTFAFALLAVEFLAFALVTCGHSDMPHSARPYETYICGR